MNKLYLHYLCSKQFYMWYLSVKSHTPYVLCNTVIQKTVWPVIIEHDINGQVACMGFICNEF